MLTVLAAPLANLASIEPVDRLLAAPVAGEVMSAASLTGLGLALSLGPARGVGEAVQSTLPVAGC